MPKFWRYFLIALAAQLPLIAASLVYKPAQLILYFLYLIPFAILGLLFPLPKQVGSEDCTICFFFLLLIPASFYAAIFASIALFIRRRFGR